MLVDLIKNVERALVSYIKMTEGSPNRLVLDKGMESLLASSNKVSETRRTDIIWIYNTCCIALDENWPISECIKNIYEYITNIDTGFLFFTGGSKLRFCIFQAIEQYDIRYLCWAQGKPLLVVNVATIPASSSLTSFLDHIDAPDETFSPSEIVQNKLDRLESQVDSMRKIIGQHDATVGSFIELMEEFKNTLRQTKQDLSDSRIENMKLQEKVIRMDQSENVSQFSDGEEIISIPDLIAKEDINATHPLRA